MFNSLLPVHLQKIDNSHVLVFLKTEVVALVQHRILSATEAQRLNELWREAMHEDETSPFFLTLLVTKHPFSQLLLKLHGARSLFTNLTHYSLRPHVEALAQNMHAAAQMMLNKAPLFINQHCAGEHTAVNASQWIVEFAMRCTASVDKILSKNTSLSCFVQTTSHPDILQVEQIVVESLGFRGAIACSLSSSYPTVITYQTIHSAVNDVVQGLEGSCRYLLASSPLRAEWKMTAVELGLRMRELEDAGNEAEDLEVMEHLRQRGLATMDQINYFIAKLVESWSRLTSRELALVPSEFVGWEENALVSLLRKGSCIEEATDVAQRLGEYCQKFSTFPVKLIDSELKTFHPNLTQKTFKEQTTESMKHGILERHRRLQEELLKASTLLIALIVIVLTVSCGVKKAPKPLEVVERDPVPYRVEAYSKKSGVHK